MSGLILLNHLEIIKIKWHKLMKIIIIKIKINNYWVQKSLIYKKSDFNKDN
jgi:hypothetical protein